MHEHAISSKQNTIAIANIYDIINYYIKYITRTKSSIRILNLVARKESTYIFTKLYAIGRAHSKYIWLLTMFSI